MIQSGHNRYPQAVLLGGKTCFWSVYMHPLASNHATHLMYGPSWVRCCRVGDGPSGWCAANTKTCISSRRRQPAHMKLPHVPQGRLSNPFLSAYLPRYLCLSAPEPASALLACCKMKTLVLQQQTLSASSTRPQEHSIAALQHMGTNCSDVESASWCQKRPDVDHTT